MQHAVFSDSIADPGSSCSARVKRAHHLDEHAARVLLGCIAQLHTDKPCWLRTIDIVACTFIVLIA